MAVLAGHFNVATQQRKISEVMFECVFIELHDVGVSTFVICMAIYTFVVRCIVEQPVKSAAGLDIGRNVLVAVEAQRALVRTFERFVTGRAFRLPLGMALYDFTGHDQRLDGRGIDGVSFENCYSNCNSN